MSLVGQKTKSDFMNWKLKELVKNIRWLKIPPKSNPIPSGNNSGEGFGRILKEVKKD
jgi:hypothetical protein